MNTEEQKPQDVLLGILQSNVELTNSEVAKIAAKKYPNRFRGRLFDSMRRQIGKLRRRYNMENETTFRYTKTSPRVLLVDIETAPVIASIWRLYDENVGLEQIKKDRHLLSFAAKWLGSDVVYYEDQSCARSMEDDTRLLKLLWKLLDEADIVVAHNGRAFDVPMIQARMVIKGFTPPSPFRHVDTLKEARKHFGFTSNKLAYISEKMGCPKSAHKDFPGFELWKECLNRNKKAWAEMKHYNIQDVKALEVVYLKLRPWIEGHPNVAIYVDSDKPMCPKCGGDVKEQKKMAITNFGKYKRYLCSSCKSWSRGRTLMNTTVERKRQLAN